MILKEIVDAINVLNTKIDAIAECMYPMQETMKMALANVAFDKDLISYLMQAASKDLANLDAQAYAKYVEGMTALGKKRGAKEAQEFSAAMEALERAVPESFLDVIRQSQDEVEGWKAKVDQSLQEVRDMTVSMNSQIAEFKEQALLYDKKVKGAARTAGLQMQKSMMEVRGQMEDSINDMKNQVNRIKDSSHNLAVDAVKKAKKEMSSEMARAMSELDTATQDMEKKRELLEDLAKKAGQNIIETGRVIAQKTNSLPRNQRGRRNN